MSVPLGACAVWIEELPSPLEEQRTQHALCWLPSEISRQDVSCRVSGSDGPERQNALPAAWSLTSHPV
eukprot:1607660-Rhodomonas_salina.1